MNTGVILISKDTAVTSRIDNLKEYLAALFDVPDGHSLIDNIIVKYCGSKYLSQRKIFYERIVLKSLVFKNNPLPKRLMVTTETRNRFAINFIGNTKKSDAVYYAGFIDLGHFYVIINDEE